MSTNFSFPIVGFLSPVTGNGVDLYVAPRTVLSYFIDTTDTIIGIQKCKIFLPFHGIVLRGYKRYSIHQ